MFLRQNGHEQNVHVLNGSSQTAEIDTIGQCRLGGLINLANIQDLHGNVTRHSERAQLVGLHSKLESFLYLTGTSARKIHQLAGRHTERDVCKFSIGIHDVKPRLFPVRISAHLDSLALF